MVQDWGGPIGLGFAGPRPELVHSFIIRNTQAWPATNAMSLSQKYLVAACGDF